MPITGQVREFNYGSGNIEKLLPDDEGFVEWNLIFNDHKSLVMLYMDSFRI